MNAKLSVVKKKMLRKVLSTFIHTQLYFNTGIRSLYTNWFTREPCLFKHKYIIVKNLAVCVLFLIKWCHTKVLKKRFDLNGYTIRFCWQTENIERHYLYFLHN